MDCQILITVVSNSLCLAKERKRTLVPVHKKKGILSDKFGTFFIPLLQDTQWPQVLLLGLSIKIFRSPSPMTHHIRCN